MRPCLQSLYHTDSVPQTEHDAAPKKRLASTSAHLPPAAESAITSIQEAVEISEDLALAIQEFGLTDDLFVVIDVRNHDFM